MGVDEGNIQVIDGCRNNFSYGAYFLQQVEIMVYKLRKLNRDIYSVHICLNFTLCVCVFFPFILDFNGSTSRGHTGRR